MKKIHKIILIFILTAAVLRIDFVYPQDTVALRPSLSYGANNKSKALNRFNIAAIISNKEVKNTLKEYNEDIKRINRIQKTGDKDLKVDSRWILFESQGYRSSNISYAVEKVYLWPDRFYVAYYDFASLFNSSLKSRDKEGFRTPAMQRLLRNDKDSKREFLGEIMKAVAFNQLRENGVTYEQIKNIKSDKKLLYQYYAIIYQMWTETVKWLSERQGPENTLNLGEYSGDRFISDIYGAPLEEYLKENNLIGFDVYRQVGLGRYYILRGNIKKASSIFNKALIDTNYNPQVILLIIKELFWLQKKGIPGFDEIAKGLNIKFIEDCLILKEFELIIKKFQEYYTNEGVVKSIREKYKNVLVLKGFVGEIRHFIGKKSEIFLAMNIIEPVLESFLKQEIEIDILIDQLNKAKEDIKVHLGIVRARAKKETLDNYINTLLKTQGEEKEYRYKRELGKFMSERNDFREFYRECMGKYYEYVDKGYKRCEEIIDYFKERMAASEPTSQNGVIKAMDSLKTVSTAN